MPVEFTPLDPRIASSDQERIKAASTIVEFAAFSLAGSVSRGFVADLMLIANELDNKAEMLTGNS